MNLEIGINEVMISMAQKYAMLHVEFCKLEVLVASLQKQLAEKEVTVPLNQA